MRAKYGASKIEKVREAMVVKSRIFVNTKCLELPKEKVSAFNPTNDRPK